MPKDDYGSQADTLSSSSLAPVEITPNDNADLVSIPKALWIGIGGDVRLRGVNGQSVTFPNVPDGFILPVRARTVYATGTTASGIIAL